MSALGRAVVDMVLVVLAAPELPLRREWWSTRDVAVYTGRTVDTVQDWILTRGLPATRRKRRRLWIARDDLAAWLTANPWALSSREQRLRRFAKRLRAAALAESEPRRLTP